MKRWHIATLLLGCTAVCFGQTVDHPLHVGGDVKPPKIILQVDADFSQIKGKKTEPSALVFMVVDVDGVPQRLELLKSSSPEVGRAFLEAAAKYRFRPATREGIPVAVELSMEMNANPF